MSAYSGAEGILALIKQQRQRAQESTVNAEAKTLSAGYEGLDKYQNIENPFTRRALASKYQTSVGAEYKNLIGEEERRKGVITDYINMWAGTYGALAKGEQMKLEGLQQEFNMEKSLADSKVSEAKSASTASEKNYTEQQIRQGINEAFGRGKSWEEIAQTYGALGIDVASGSVADNELRRLHGHDPISGKEKEGNPKQQSDDKYYQYINEINGGNTEYKMDEDGNILKKSGQNWRGADKWEIVFQKP
jgi:hypothetical protein